jgi:hypothetical protein
MSENDKPAILVDVFGTSAPAAAKFGVGAGLNDIKSIQDAIDARNNLSGPAPMRDSTKR